MTRPGLAAALCVVVLGPSLAAPTARAAKGDKVAAAKKFYGERRFPEAIAACDKALAQAKLPRPKRIECMELQAFAWFLLAEIDKAKAAWLRLLDFEPSHRLDPIMVSPEFVNFFGKLTPAAPVTATPPPPAAPMPASPGPAPAPAVPSDEPMGEMPQPLAPSTVGTRTSPRLASPTSPSPPPSTPITTEVTEPALREEILASPTETPSEPVDAEVTSVRTPLRRPCGVVLCLIPFGVGQFVNGEPVKGAVFAAGELGFLAVNLALYWARVSEYNEHGRLRDLDAANAGFVVQHVALGLFGAALVGGVIDALLFGD